MSVDWQHGERLTLEALEVRDDFVRRHIGPSQPDIDAMLASLDGVGDLEELVERTVPKSIQQKTPLNVPESISERRTQSALRAMAQRNKVFRSMIGAGYHGTITPPVILRNVMENPGWYTAYTPYQAEVSQGRLEALLNFQQMIVDLTGMELANASLLDEGTAAAEGMAMAKRTLRKNKSSRFFVDADIHPQTLAVIETRARYLGIEIVLGDAEADLADQPDLFGLLIQNPGSSGRLRDVSAEIETVHGMGGLAIVATDPMALVLTKSPGEMGADIVVGSAQRFGVPMGYGGPHAAFFATREAYKRSTPGRIIGVSVDAEGRQALRMALQTREQHIRRDKATSNICTAQVLLAVIAGFYAVYHGPEGLQRISGRIHRKAEIVAEGLRRLGFGVVHDCFYDTVKLAVPGQASKLAAKARAAGINLRVHDPDHLGITVDETTKRQDLKDLFEVFSSVSDERPSIETLDREVGGTIPGTLVRRGDILTHDVFHLYHSETEMMRYLRWLQAKDVALDRAMIPLGSCTMKLNAATEMIPVTWREFAHIHPFAPLDQAQGYQQLFEELEAWLADITGYDSISFMPNAGSQGEYTGLLVIRQYLAAKGEGHRDICLIPSSAHGTNPASAVMAGLEVVVVECDDDGNVDVEDLKAKAGDHGDRLAAIMITYPSTHGVFEERVAEICEIVHDHGGQVYVDGANLNAMVGICRPGDFGADVSHLNLHKTFCIPHGGGGPGMGPIGVKRHLAAFLPNHPLVPGVNPAAHDGEPVGPVSAAPYGSASILPISWAYIRMMGPSGLRRATQVAILNANYIARRLSDHFEVLYTGRNGMVAHECILDCRPFEESAGVTVEDIAKRLVDYGFHAPTMSFPVAGTLMIEPTESEAKRELDRFCDTMIAIREEIRAIEAGEADRENNLLKNAPHTHHLLMAEAWDRPYSKEAAFFPLKALRADKFWPPVARVDNVAGDRHLVCTCPPIDEYRAAAE
ncbi:aminomethyl-transferring glycine dehydrogenase [Marivibrio halodurans]|uniref:Glycine dehydrogenase (decarboxylating) n=1 Tax=Marivibrio halodurans TaxID=2039722 RepID=A0A8J7V3I9_9PROT|nr:aminomethyl-transferring glycine dehydrogenase [Marivibrio halodurans]MBP5858296.1 aminomethyl-transferring glycine dehydrogenase [Marivibrio halodurans]